MLIIIILLSFPTKSLSNKVEYSLSFPPPKPSSPLRHKLPNGA